MSPELERALNEAAAKLCGREKIDVIDDGEWDGYQFTGGNKYTLWCKGGEDHECIVDEDPRSDPSSYCWLPDYCTDRNALPELWSIFEKSGTRLHFQAEAYNFYREQDAIYKPEWFFMTMQPYLQVIAALKATGNWTDALEELWEKTKCSS